MPDRFDWRADVRARLAAARLNPDDEADMVEEIGDHLDEQFNELAPLIGAAKAREQLLAELRDRQFDDAVAGKRRRATPSKARVWSSTSWFRDVRHGVRSLRRNPGTVVAGSAALALGIGLTVMMFSVIYGLLIKGLPFDDPSRIAIVKLIDPRQPGVDALIPLGDFARYRTQQRTFEKLAAYATATVNMSGGDRPDRVEAARVTVGALDATRVSPALGRLFGDADVDPAASPTAILGYALWRDRFAASPTVIGATIRVDGRPHTIVGVMPANYEFPFSTRLWLPLQANPAAFAPGDGPVVNLAGRLRADVTYDNATAEFAGLAARLAHAHATTDTTMRVAVLPFVRASVNPRFYWLMDAMFIAVVLVLLVACANVANLLLARAANRTREIGIRTALGASRLAIVRQAMVESSLLAVSATIGGVAIAQLGVTLFNRAMAGSPTPLFWMDVRLHPAVLLFVMAVAVVASVVSGLAPAIQSAYLDINAILKDESQGASSLRMSRLSRVIVVAEIAMSSAILLASGFITRSIVSLSTVNPRFVTDGILTARLTLTTADEVRQRSFFEALDRELGTLDPLGSASIGNGLPGAGWIQHHLVIEGRPATRERERPIVKTLAVTPSFFATFGVRAVRGRTITDTDRLAAEGVAVVSESFARRYFRGGDPIGTRVRVSSDSTAPWLTVVGVVPTLFSASFDDPWPAEVLTSFWQQSHFGSAVIALRTNGAAPSAGALRRLVARIDPETPLYGIESMAAVMKERLWAFQVFATLFVVFGVVALVLSAIGLYAVMTFSVSRRAREMGVRLALGATAGSVLALVLRQGARQTAIGMAIGFLAGAGIVQMARAILFGVTPGDPFVFAVVATVLASATALACLIPARRATRVDPIVALRTE